MSLRIKFPFYLAVTYYLLAILNICSVINFNYCGTLSFFLSLLKNIYYNYIYFLIRSISSPCVRIIRVLSKHL
ncbi:hypothetical protein C1646_700688 [Rhizophagus diaphanus]|nr:hypothetical protein C1646_700688 [Rhizophagus diaphanus] [Rhizophagus sp. MUCL 43196]